MLNDSSFIRKISALFLFNFLIKFNYVHSSVAPVLEIENESIGYVGTIGERNVLVDLKPHLQIKNIDAINGICSYHVFKPTSEEFPFTIDIKDKTTGEAVIEVIRKEIESSSSASQSSSAGTGTGSAPSVETKPKTVFLDCNKRKEYDFLIQAHDCSSPSLSSNKVPVKIEVIDHDDYVLKFEQEDIYKKTLVESDDIYENFMAIRARDNDCTNDGYACSYKLLSTKLTSLDKLFPFRIDNTGLLSALRSVKKGESFEFTVRAFDCLNNQSFVDAQVSINVIEPCVPQWTEFSTDVLPTLEKTNLFETLNPTTCEQSPNVFQKQDTICNIDSVNSKLVLNLDPSITNNCQQEKCDQSSNEIETKPAKLTLFSGGAAKSQTEEDDDSIEDEDDVNDENKVVPSNGILPVLPSDQSKEPAQLKAPLSYQSFSKSIENAQKIDFDGKFNNEFVLSAWLRRPANADKTLKEQVICGTDSKSMNRHHFGLYFYRGNLKFLLRREPNQIKDSIKQDSSNLDSSNIDSNEAFYPSLWEWSLYEPLLSDAKWHFYEIKFNYPNVSLFIDGVRFVENTTNSDIIDAYELNDASDTGSITSYVGACYHARTQSLTDHFEGDIGSIVITKTEKSKQPATDSSSQKPKCKLSCNEFIEIATENLQSVESSNTNEISLKASSLNDMAQLIKKVSYINKETYPQVASRSIKLSTTIHCKNNDKQIVLNDVNVNINTKRQKQEYKIQLEGDKQLFATKLDLENGIEPFKDVSINKIPVNKNDASVNSFDSTEDESDENSLEIDSDSADSLKFSKCQIKISPERNLMAPSLNNEKVMFLQNLLDEFAFKFEETKNTVVISGSQSIENYETFIRRLTYVIININEVEQSNLALIKNKKFYVSCFRADSNVETNSVLVQVNLTRNDQDGLNSIAKNVPGLVAHKQLQTYVVSENEDDIIQKKSGEFSALTSNNNVSNPMVVALLVMASCAIGFLLVFGAIRFYTTRIVGQKRKALPNEENPQMEWDDSGLNITENPLETLEINKENELNAHPKHNLEYEGEEYTSSEDDEEDFNEDDQYSSEEEPEKVVDRELEWDDTSLEIKVRDKQQQQQQQLSKNLSNKSTSNFIDPNKFV